MSFDITYYKIVSQFEKVAVVQYLDDKTTSTEYLSTGFFNAVASQLAKGSVIFASSTTGVLLLAVTDISNGVVTVANNITPAPVPTTAALQSVRMGINNPINSNEINPIPGFPLTQLTSTIQKTDIGGSIICTIEDTFINAEDTQNETNWIIDTGTTGLSLSEIIYVDEHNARLVFAGEAKEGLVQIAPKTNILENETRYTAGVYAI